MENQLSLNKLKFLAIFKKKHLIFLKDKYYICTYIHSIHSITVVMHKHVGSMNVPKIFF